jgi:hypothetical protein
LDGVRSAPQIFTQLDAPIVRLLMTFNDNVIGKTLRTCDVKSFLFFWLVLFAVISSSDFFSEYIGIAALVTYYGESISNDMWMVFERLCESVLHVGDDFLEGMLCLE